MEKKQIVWIARDKDNALYIYDKKPILGDENKDGVFFVNNGKSCQIGSYFFPEITFENSPKILNIANMNS